jgi:hypothetical protein
MGIIASSCGDKASLIEIDSRTEDGFHDIVLTIVQSEKLDEEYEIVAKGLYKGETVGIKLRVKDNLKEGLANGGFDGFDTTAVELNGVSFSSIGDESNKLTKVLSNLYGYPTDKAFTMNDTRFDMFSLNAEQADLSKGYFKFKLFFDPYDSLGLYSELFLNVNIPENEIELNEKDLEYRPVLIKALTR